MTVRPTPSALGQTSSDEPEASLREALWDAAGAAGLSVSDVSEPQLLSGGASKQMWGFDLTLRDGTTRPLVLRRQPPGRALSDYGLDSVRREAAVIRIAETAGVPVPHIAFKLPEGSPAGDGYAMARIDGETLGGRIVKSPELTGARTGLAFRCGEVLARLHSVRGEALSGLPSRSAREALALLAERRHATGQHRPVFDFALEWLGDNLPHAGSAGVLCHGDFRTGNLVVGPAGLRAVLDWELAHLGPPAADLGWLCVPSWRFQRPDLPVGGFGTRDDLLAGYAAGGGIAIDPAELFAWEVFGALNWGVMCAGAGRAFMDGLRSVEGAVIARRASETEFDLMRMLAPDHPAWESETAEPRRFDDPPASAILAIVEEMSAGDVMPQFAQRVSANASGIAQRELATSLRHDAGEEPVAALILDCLGKLAVDQPSYSGLAALRTSAVVSESSNSRRAITLSASVSSAPSNIESTRASTQ